MAEHPERRGAARERAGEPGALAPPVSRAVRERRGPGPLREPRARLGWRARQVAAERQRRGRRGPGAPRAGAALGRRVTAARAAETPVRRLPSTAATPAR